MKLTIYKLQNITTGKVYIGSTLKDFESRLYDHKLKPTEGHGGNRGLCEWYPDINPDDLIGEVLEVINDPSDDEIRYRHRESYYCKLYRSLGYELYNKRLDAIHHSEESKKKISESLKGRSCPEGSREFLRKYAEHMKGNLHMFHHIIKYKGETHYSSTELHSKLLSEGYELTYHQVNNLVGGFFSKKNRAKYPELLDSLEVLV